MSNHVLELERQAKLRERALGRLTHDHIQTTSRAGASRALGVLHELASSPETAGDALALLHELQVHQVELEMQEEELRKSRAELEVRLGRHAQLYESSPIASFTIDRNKVIGDVNWAAARLLGHTPEQVNGKRLDDYLRLDGIQGLEGLFPNGSADGDTKSVALTILAADGKLRSVRAAVCADPAGGGIMVAVVDVT